ncbi:hypothetical protein QBC32DRAFT_137554, partial [Pseudoneurospora amorphoporcata]
WISRQPAHPYQAIVPILPALTDQQIYLAPLFTGRCWFSFSSLPFFQVKTGLVFNLSLFLKLYHHHFHLSVPIKPRFTTHFQTNLHTTSPQQKWLSFSSAVSRGTRMITCSIPSSRSSALSRKLLSSRTVIPVAAVASASFATPAMLMPRTPLPTWTARSSMDAESASTRPPTAPAVAAVAASVRAAAVVAMAAVAVTRVVAAATRAAVVATAASSTVARVATSSRATASVAMVRLPSRATTVASSRDMQLPMAPATLPTPPSRASSTLPRVNTKRRFAPNLVLA